MNIDVNRLQQEINKAEAAQTFKNQSELFQYLSNTDWAKNQRKPFSSSVLYLRYKQNNLIIKTLKGKRGREVGTAVNRVNKSDKICKYPNFKENVESLKRDLPNNPKLVENIVKGSLKAAVAAQCILCCGGDKSLVKSCNVISCSLYLFSPYVNRNR